MDKLFKSDEKNFISPAINLRKFMAEVVKAENQILHSFLLNPTSGTSIDNGEGEEHRNKFRQFMMQNGFPSAEADMAIGTSDAALISILEDCPMDEYEITFPPKDSKLMTHKTLHNIRENYQTSSVKNSLVGRGKYFKYREQELKRYYNSTGVRPQRDMVLTVNLLKPMNHPPDRNFEYTNVKHRCEVKLLVRGSLPLTKLREKIFCASDFWTNVKDFQDLSDANSYFNNKFPSSFLFIHDTFYVDMRHPNAVDITAPVREFMERKKKDFGHTEVKDMANVKIIDLTLRLGHPYLFLHQGLCEHVLIFTDLRLLNSSDAQNESDYPIRLFDVISQKICCVCDSQVAVFVVTESDRLPTSPAFFCRKCFTDFHYQDGFRIGEFEAFHYIDRAGIE